MNVAQVHRGDGRSGRRTYYSTYVVHTANYQLRTYSYYNKLADVSLREKGKGKEGREGLARQVGFPLLLGKSGSNVVSAWRRRGGPRWMEEEVAAEAVATEAVAAITRPRGHKLHSGGGGQADIRPARATSESPHVASNASTVVVLVCNSGRERA